jgi:hypothetical protein
MHITNGLNDRGTQVSLGLNPFVSQVTVITVPVPLLDGFVSLLPLRLLEFTTEGMQSARLKASLYDCPVCDCGDAVTAFIPTGLLPQQDPTNLPKLKDFSKENTPGGSEIEAYSVGQPDPQADPANLATPTAPASSCSVPDASLTGCCAAPVPTGDKVIPKLRW